MKVLTGITVALLLSTAALVAGPADGGEQPNLVAVKADFIAGEKTLFFDDFTDMQPDEAPPHWKVRGGAFTLKEGGGIRQATTTAEKSNMTPLLSGIPRNFTVETEVKYENAHDLRVIWSFRAKGKDDPALQVWTQTRGDVLRVTVTAGGESLADTEVPCNFDQPVKQALWVQNGRVRFYANNQRMMDANQVTLPPLESALLETEIYGDGGVVGYRSMRIAESTPDFSHSILSTGRYVTYGILFDTDRDVLKAESAGVIKSIAAGLQANPALKMRIEGHTDSTGNAAHNLDLSKRRAEAVKAVLVSQFQVDPGRLTAEGMGATKPTGPNDTPQGRAQNRRVEFVKQ